MSNEQVSLTDKKQQEEIPAYPFPFADHSLECPALYDQLREKCPVARVHMPFGGDAYLLTRHADVIKAWTDPKCGVIQSSDGDVPRREVSKLGTGGEEMVTIMSVPDARHNQTRRLVTQAFTVKAANDLSPRVEEVTNALIDAMDGSVFSQAHEIDFDREYNPMVTFGRGIHACLGQQIARMELRVLWSTLLRRLPTVRLAVAPEDVPWRPDDTATFGPAHIPVTWE